MGYSLVTGGKLFMNDKAIGYCREERQKFVMYKW